MVRDSTINGKIYCITNSVNGKQYIGQTKRSVESRWKQHVNVHTKSSYYLYRAMQKYGVDKFSVQEIVSGISNQKELDNMERKLILEYGTFGNGYNLTSGGEGGYLRSASSIAKVSGANNYMFGKTHSDEVKKRISEKATGRKLSKETIEKISRSLIGNKYSSTTHLADYSRKRADKTEYTFYHAQHGVVTTYQSELASRFNLHTSAVANVVKGIYKSTRGWMLKEKLGSIAIKNTVHTLYNSHTNSTVEGTCAELAGLLKVGISTVQRLVNGQRKQTRQGWEFKKEVTNEL